MTLYGILGAVLALLGALAGVYRVYITWHAKRDAKREIEAANAVAEKNKREARVYAAPKRDLADILKRMRDARDGR